MLVLDIYSAVITHLDREWSYTEIEQENVTSKSITPPYIRATIIPTTNNKVEVGIGGSSKYDAILVIDIFTELGTGIGIPSELIGNIINNTDGVFLAGKTIISDNDVTIRFTAPQVLQGRDDLNGFYQNTVHCPFYFYH